MSDFSLDSDLSEPIAQLHGFKRAYIVVRLQDDVVTESKFQAHVWNEIYTAVSQATCKHGCGNAIPSPTCSCGFYALKEEPTIEKNMFEGATFRNHPGTSVVLNVELFGTVAEGVKGWRASDQQVIAAQFDGFCRRCGRNATTLIAAHTPPGLEDPWQCITALCETCAKKPKWTGTPVTPASLAGTLHTEVSSPQNSKVDDLTLLQRIVIRSEAYLWRVASPTWWILWFLLMFVAAAFLKGEVLSWDLLYAVPWFVMLASVIWLPVVLEFMDARGGELKRERLRTGIILLLVLAIVVVVFSFVANDQTNAIENAVELSVTSHTTPTGLQLF